MQKNGPSKNFNFLSLSLYGKQRYFSLETTFSVDLQEPIGINVKQQVAFTLFMGSQTQLTSFLLLFKEPANFERETPLIKSWTILQNHCLSSGYQFIYYEINNLEKAFKFCTAGGLFRRFLVNAIPNINAPVFHWWTFRPQSCEHNICIGLHTFQACS